MGISPTKGRDFHVIMQKVLEFIRKFGAPIIALFVPVLAFAQNFAPAPSGVVAPGSVLNNVSQVPTLACTIVDWLFWALIVFAVIMVLLAAYGYVSSGGDPDKTKAASQKLLYAAIAVVVAIIAVGFPDLVSSFLGDSASKSVLSSC